MMFSLSSISQIDQCGTMGNLKLMIQKDPSLKLKMDSIEFQTQEIIKSRRTEQINYQDKNLSNSDKAQGIQSLCGDDNIYFATIAAPTTVGQITSPNPDCTYGGEYVTVTGLVAGRTYRVSLCGANNFDTQLTIYPQGGGNAVAHNDDWCGTQSEIYFTPIVSGNYDLLVDAYDCADNTLCANMAVELWYIPRPKIIIPVVVHVIHFGEAIGTGRNISTAQINSQISVLNADFRRLNADFSAIPAAFRGTSADPLIEFCLAQQDEFGNPTTGILRYTASNPQVTVDDIEVSIKPSTIWDRNKYLNLWTVDFGAPDESLLGFAQFPGGPANTDGVVIKYTAFGNVGILDAPYNLGRTATHEVGHWLNLKHIWGDDTGCSGTDLVSDTPNQSVASSGFPAFPLTDECSVNYPGINFYNYMDYSNDAATSMFTYGQWVRMDATLFGPRISLQTSQGCMSPDGIDENFNSNDYLIYPNPTTGKISIKTNSISSKNINVSIYSVVGQQIWKNNDNDIINGNLTIDLTGNLSGVYFVEITTNGKHSVQKIILNSPN